MAQSHEGLSPTPDGDPASSKGSNSGDNAHRLWDPSNGIARRPQSLDEIGVMFDDEPRVLALPAVNMSDVENVIFDTQQPEETDQERKERLHSEAWNALFDAFVSDNLSLPESRRSKLWGHFTQVDLDIVTPVGMEPIDVQISSMDPTAIVTNYPASLQISVFDKTGRVLTAARSRISYERIPQPDGDTQTPEFTRTFMPPNYVLDDEGGFTKEKLWEIMNTTAQKIQNREMPPDEFAV